MQTNSARFAATVCASFQKYNADNEVVYVAWTKRAIFFAICISLQIISKLHPSHLFIAILAMLWRKCAQIPIVF